MRFIIHRHRTPFERIVNGGHVSRSVGLAAYCVGLGLLAFLLAYNWRTVLVILFGGPD
jgi:hypothetical protein